MSAPLQKTKLFTPAVRQHLVARSRLVDRLNALRVEPCQAALISAPAGSGKTTITVQWLTQLGWPAAWVSLDQRDNHPARFFSYLITALQSIQPGAGEQALPLLGLSGANWEEVVTILTNDLLEAPGPFVLILDDYHTITQPILHHAIDQFIDSLPPQMRLVLLTREDPSIQLARRRSLGQLVELRQGDLRFTHAEALAFLNQQMGLRLSVAQVEALENRTEGWIAGLQMAALSLSQSSDVEGFIQAFSGTHRFILDYLIEEVLAHQPAEIQRFLLDTSPFERICAGLCAAVTGQEPSHTQSLIETLTRSNLFVIPLDEDRYWFRYHHLFADLLRSRLELEDPAHMAALYRRASDWYENHGDPLQAVECALKTQDFDRAADLFAANITQRWQTVDFDFFMLVNRLPMDVIARRPSLCLHEAWTCVISGQVERIPALLDAAEGCLLAPDRVTTPSDAANLAFSKILRANLDDLHNLPVHIDEAFERAFAAIPEENVGMRNSVAVILGTICFMEADFSGAMSYFEDALARDRRVDGTNAIPITTMRISWVYQALGRLRDAATLLQAQAEYIAARGSRRYYISGAINLLWGEILLEWGRLDEAEAQIQAGLRLLRDWPFSPTTSLGLCLLAQLYLARGDLEKAQAFLAEAWALEKKTLFHPKFFEILVQTQMALWIAAKDFSAIERWAGEKATLLGQPLCFRYEPLLIEVCRAWLALGREDEAAELLERLLSAADGRPGSQIAILTLLAAAYHADPERAFPVLEKALQLGEHEGYLRTFTLAGVPMRDVLKDWIKSGHSQRVASRRTYAKRILADFSATPHEMRTAPAPIQPLVEPLSPREMEVLNWVAAGLTNQQIASRLVISIRTVKKHVENIHGKLGVQNRTEAVARARELGLL